MSDDKKNPSGDRSRTKEHNSKETFQHERDAQQAKETKTKGTPPSKPKDPVGKP